MIQASKNKTSGKADGKSRQKAAGAIQFALAFLIFKSERKERLVPRNPGMQVIPGFSIEYKRLARFYRL
jgi:hypothetical protein